MKLKNMTLKDLPFYEGENGEYKTAKPMKHAVTLEILREWANAKVAELKKTANLEQDIPVCEESERVEAWNIFEWIIKNFNLEG